LTYSGKYKVKNPAKYKGDHTNVVYRSHWEKLCFIWCDNNSSIVEWSSEEVIIPYLYEIDKKYHRYFMDLKIKTNEGKVILVEIKPAKQTKPPSKPDKSKRYISEALTYVKNQNKWKAASQFAKDRGWDFQIWTEDTLKNLGIMKEMKTLKPLKPFRKPVAKKR
jgi:hypothetical protein